MHVFEADSRVGGHANTVEFLAPSGSEEKSSPVDTCVHPDQYVSIPTSADVLLKGVCESPKRHERFERAYGLTR